MNYKELLEKNCTTIVQEVLSVMAQNRKKVSDIKLSDIPNTSVIYRWWFPQAFVEEFLSLYIREHSSILNGIESSSLIDGETTYYALYLGKSINGRHRFAQHTTGNVHTSTLRHTLYGLQYDMMHYDEVQGEDKISKFLDDCYFEWCSYENEPNLIECVEAICITLGNYPLNIDSNPNITPEWRNYLMYVRSSSEKFREQLKKVIK